MNKSLENIIGVEEAAEILGLSPGTIKNYCAAGKLPGKKIGKTWVLDKNKLEEEEHKMKIQSYVGKRFATVEYTNESDRYQVMGGLEDVIFSGTEKECEDKMETINVENSKWGVIQIVAPGEKVTREFQSQVYESVEVDEEEFKEDLFNLLTGGNDDKN